MRYRFRNLLLVTGVALIVLNACARGPVDASAKALPSTKQAWLAATEFAPLRFVVQYLGLDLYFHLPLPSDSSTPRSTP